LSCKPLLYIPASSDNTEQEILLSGRKIYVEHCSSCHNLHLPNEYTADGWKKELDKMGERAAISEKQKLLIHKYLTYKP
jgi:mono/diheme cytochrome c family protein